MNPQINLPLNAETPERDVPGFCDGNKVLAGLTEVRQLSYFPNLPSRPTERATHYGCVKLFNKVQHETSDFVPAHPDRLPEAGRINRKIYVLGCLAESSPLRKLFSTRFPLTKISRQGEGFAVFEEKRSTSD